MQGIVSGSTAIAIVSLILSAGHTALWMWRILHQPFKWWHQCLLLTVDILPPAFLAAFLGLQYKGCVNSRPQQCIIVIAFRLANIEEFALTFVTFQAAELQYKTWLWRFAKLFWPVCYMVAWILPVALIWSLPWPHQVLVALVFQSVEQTLSAAVAWFLGWRTDLSPDKHLYRCHCVRAVALTATLVTFMALIVSELLITPVLSLQVIVLVSQLLPSYPAIKRLTILWRGRDVSETSIDTGTEPIRQVTASFMGAENGQDIDVHMATPIRLRTPCSDR